MAMTMVAYLYDLDERFFVGWRLDAGWVLTTVSWVLEVMVAAGLAVSAVVLLPEGGYELIK